MSSIYENFDLLEEICYKKCLSNKINIMLNVPEKTCLTRCIFKYKEAEEFGKQTLKFIKFKVKESQIKKE